jgi:NCS1 family nucleobase:cation symporter-1
MAHCIPTYMLASGLMASGMNWSQALVTILLGQHHRPDPILLNSHPGTKYGIPFPVFARAAYGTLGSNVPALMRALVACGWFGIQAWIGGRSAQHLLQDRDPGWPTLLGAGFGGHTTTAWLSFLLFWGLNVFIIYRGMDLVARSRTGPRRSSGDDRRAAVVGGLARQRPRAAARAAGKFPHARRVLAGVRAVAHRDDRLLGDALAQHARLHPLRPQPARAGVGQVVALPTTMSLFAAMGVMITERDRDHLRRIDLGSGRARRQVHLAAGGRRCRCSR